MVHQVKSIDEIDASFVERFGKDWAKGRDADATAEDITNEPAADQIEPPKE